jgi:hypothetical protein
VRDRYGTSFRGPQCAPPAPLFSHRDSLESLARFSCPPLVVIRELEVDLLFLSCNMTGQSQIMGGRNVDAVLCSVQTGTQESQASRSHSLRVRLGLVTTVVIRIGIAIIS